MTQNNFIAPPFVFLLSFIIAGCASYKPAEESNRTSTQETIKNEITLSEGEINLHFSIIEDKLLAIKYLGIDPYKSNMIPAVIKIVNNGKELLKLDVLSCFLVTDFNERYHGLPVEEAIKRALRSDASNIGWTIGFGLVGGLIAGDNAASANKSLEEDYHDKYFKPTLINSGSLGEGIIFFDFPPKAQNHLKGSTIILSKIDSDEKIKFNVELDAK